MKKILGVAAVVVVVGATGMWLARRGGAETTSYRLVPVERGSLEQVVSATGALSPVTVVDVGTQVSGQIAELEADFNDQVRKGQLLARIDDTIQRQAVRDAEASLERAQADLNQKEREFERTKELHAGQGVTDSEYDTAEYDLAVSRANLKSANVSLERARNNLAYTEIYSPIDGIVIQRNVDVGQTVAASFSAPQLFLIAADLTKMEILASVDESDIGSIHDGQPARFTVQAWPDRTFEGTVRQVRLQSSTQENVVNYTVVIAVDNPDGALFPGMTATVDFVVARADDVLKVPNAALRFQPPDEVLAELRKRFQEARARGGSDSSTTAPRAGAFAGAARVDPASDRGAAGAAGMALASGVAANRRAGMGTGVAGARWATASRLWTLDADGRVTPVRVRPGISDGQYTEVTGRGLEEGTQVIAGLQSRSAGSSSTASPFQPQGGDRFRRPPPF